MIRAVHAAVLGTALWLSGAVFAPAGAGGGAWVAALPAWPALVAAIAAAALLLAWQPMRSTFALLPLVGVLLPWMPLVDAGLVYAGPLVVLIWMSVIALGWGGVIRSRIASSAPARSATAATLSAFVIAFALTAIAAWLVTPMRPGGDEPHYLIMTQSLMQDGDLRIENNHAQRDYAAYVDYEMDPQYLTRGRDNAIYPVHAPGLAAVVIPAFAVGGYAGVVIFLLLVMAAASALLWRLAWMATGDIGAAWFGWAVVAASCPWVFQSFLVFPEALAGAAVAVGLWLVLRLDRGAPPSALLIAAVSAALALLPWLHTRLAVLAAGLGVMILLRLRSLGARTIAAFLAAPLLAAAGWFAFFQFIYGSPSPLGPWGNAEGSSLGWIPTGLAGALFDQQFGLLPYAPALAAGLAGLFAGGAAGWRRATRLQIVWLLVVPYVMATTSYVMWWGGLSVPARLLTALLPVLAPAAAVCWLTTRSLTLRVAMTAALGWTIFATISMAFIERGALAWNVRQHKAGLWFEWLVPAMRWTESLPAFFRADSSLGRESLPLAAFYIVTVVWIATIVAALAAAALIARRVTARRRGDQTVRGAAIAITALIVAVPAATVVALRAQGADASSSSRAQVAFLNRLASGDTHAIDLAARRTASPAELLSQIRIESAGAPFAVGPVPEGQYRLSATPAGASGTVIVGRSRQSVAVLGDAPIDLMLPVAVASLEVKGADGRTVTLQPLAIAPTRSRAHALRAADYGAAVVYFVDNRVYDEREGFWVRGSRYARVVLQGQAGAAALELEIRNGPVDNHLDIVGAGRPVSIAMVPGQVVTVPVALDARGSARLQITSRNGFVPADIEPGNRDRRSLGVFVRIR